MAGYFGPASSASHGHTATPGDGGVLNNLGVIGTLSATGQVSAGAGLAVTGMATETGTPGATANDLVPLNFSLMLALAGG